MLIPFRFPFFSLITAASEGGNALSLISSASPIGSRQTTQNRYSPDSNSGRRTILTLWGKPTPTEEWSNLTEEQKSAAVLDKRPTLTEPSRKNFSDSLERQTFIWVCSTGKCGTRSTAGSWFDSNHIHQLAGSVNTFTDCRLEKTCRSSQGFLAVTRNPFIAPIIQW